MASLLCIKEHSLCSVWNTHAQADPVTCRLTTRDCWSCSHFLLMRIHQRNPFLFKVQFTFKSLHTPTVTNSSPLNYYLHILRVLHVATAWWVGVHESSLSVEHPGYQVLSDILFRLGLIANCSHTVQYLDCSDLNWRCNHFHLFWHCMTLLVLMCR